MAIHRQLRLSTGFSASGGSYGAVQFKASGIRLGVEQGLRRGRAEAGSRVNELKAVYTDASGAYPYDAADPSLLRISSGDEIQFLRPRLQTTETP